MATHKRLIWSPSFTEKVVRVARGATTLQDLTNLVSEMVGYKVTYSQIVNGLNRTGTTFSDLKGATQIAKGFKFPKAGDPQEMEARATREKLKELERARQELLSQLEEKNEQLGVLAQLRKAAGPKPVTARKGRGVGKKRQGTPVFLLSDWHVEEPVKPETVNGLNEFNLEIAGKCIDRIADAVDWFSRDHRWDFRQAVIWLGGDLFSGYIHEELMEQNFLSPVKAVLWLQNRLMEFFNKVLATTNFERIIVPCNDGNHGRMTHRMRVATRTSNSLEWLLYRTLAEKFSNEKRLEFQVADGEYNFLDVYDWALGFTHGDHFKYAGGVGGLLIPTRRGFNEIRKYRKLDHLSLGHFHQRTDDGEIMVNGSMIGISPYSMHIHAKPEQRQQSFFLMDSTRGKCLSAPIWL